MPEAVIVAAARSPIGRARKGSLAAMRPDDLAAQLVQATRMALHAIRAGEGDVFISAGVETRGGPA